MLLYYWARDDGGNFRRCLVGYSDNVIGCLCRIGFLSCLGEHGSEVFLFLRVNAELEWF